MNGRRGITLLSILVAGGALCAQESVGTILGAVKDDQGAPIAQATLSLTGPRMLGQRLVKTSDKGEFRLPLIPPGQYALKVSKEGYVGSKAEFTMGAGQTLRQNLSLKVIHVAGAVVEVVNAAAAVDKTETKTATSISSETLQTLPVAQRNALGALSIAPGVGGSINYAVVRGGIAGQTQTTVNGISVRDNVSRESRQTEFVLEDLTEDVTVVQSPLNAKYGNSSGGLVNVQTKNGSNSFQGSIRVKLKRPTWSALAPSTSDRFGVPTAGSKKATYTSPAWTVSDDLSKTYEVTVLGPIIKDRLTFSYGTRIKPSTYESKSIGNILGGAHDDWRTYIPAAPWAGNDRAAYTWGVDPTNPTVSPVIGGKTKFSMNQYKLYFLITPEHQVEASFSRDELDSFADQDNMDTFVNNTQSSTRDFKSLNYRGMLNSSMVLDVKWGRRETRVHFPSGPLDPINVRTWGEDATTIFNTRYSGLLLTNGNDYSSAAELRDVETISANLNWFTEKHNLDVGVELLRERAYMPEASGPNRRMFYTPGRLANGSYLVYNYVGSAAAAAGTLADTLRNNSGYVPEMRSWADDGSGDACTKDFTTSFYGNDQFAINAHWSLMLGFRYDNWKISDRTGTRIDTHAFSPRAEVKYDLQGDGRRLLSLSFADMRGTIGQGNLGGFSRKAGDIRRRAFWNVGSTTPYAVSYQELTKPENYGYYYHYQNSDALYTVDPNLRPEMARQLELGFRQAFAGGGFFRASLVYRRYKDLWYDRPTDVKTTMVDPEGGNLTASNGFAHYLTFDPMGKREHRALEMEWSYPILETATQKLDFQGNWTMARTYSRETWREGNTSDTAARWDDKFAALGISPDIYNPYGELEGSAHHTLRAWLTWTRGLQGGIRSTLTLKGEYVTAAARSRTQSYYYPSQDLAENPLFTSKATGLPTTFTAYLNGRGSFDSGDSYYADLQWNLEFPLGGRKVLFSNLTVGNVFNSLIPVGCGTGLDSSTRTWPDPDFSIRASNGGMANWGAVVGWGQKRTYSVDFGMRF